jgi:hypothetical protein
VGIDEVYMRDHVAGRLEAAVGSVHQFGCMRSGLIPVWSIGLED